MQAIILAAGRGARLKPLTDSVPKPMVNFRGAPLLEYTLSILPSEIDHVIMIVGWLEEKIHDHFGDSFAGKRIDYVTQSEPRGTFHAITCAKSFLSEEPFLIVSGDDIYSAEDLKNVASSSSLSLLASHTDNPERFGICKTGESGCLLSIVEKPKTFCGNLANIGVYKLDHQIFGESVAIGPNGEEVLALMIGTLASKTRIEVIPATLWHPIADLDDLARAQNLTIEVRPPAVEAVASIVRP
ncbi:MAG: nucleotidyltransferase family protein [Candidatus Vogelbacteria bacterium]|nr:nucleotidyltransferase family protein [Candidatus Vogelbacteria bacterium]